MSPRAAAAPLPGLAVKRRKPFALRAPIVREPVLHRQIADALRLEIAAPGRLSKDGVCWWSVDIASYLGNAPGLRITRGVVAGIPDLFILYAGLAHFLELKASDGVLSDAQREVGAAILCSQGHFGVVRSVEETLQHLDRWGIPRAHRLRGG